MSLLTGTADFSVEPAISESVMDAALTSGREQVGDTDWQVFIAGDMGIGNTNSAASMLGAVLQLPASDVTGRDTAVDNAALRAKCNLIDQALALHAGPLSTPLGVLRCVGGLEIAAMCGAYIRCAQRGMPILLDGFIATATALLTVRINPGVRDWMVAGHCSTAATHRRTLDYLELTPLLELGMRLGEGSAVSIIRSALALHARMATFADTGVTESG